MAKASPKSNDPLVVSRCYSVVVLLVLAGCASAGEETVADATVVGGVDAPLGGPDAPTASPDAPTAIADATTSSADAPVAVVDATAAADATIADATPTPDGMLPVPDAMLPTPDAMLPTPDAMLPDATPPADAPVGTTCTLQAPTFDQTTPVAIVDNTTVTSTIAVSGVDPYLWDLDLTTAITHTYNGDLTIVLISPAGTRVSLSDGLGGAADDVFNGTVWDDAAATPVVDASLPLSPVAPAGAFGQLSGQDPNGVWTLEVTDSASSDTGSINSWSLAFQTSVAPTPNVASYASSGAVAIPDNSSTTSSVVVSGAGTQICDINLTTNITHTYPGDLDLALVSPSGTRTVLVTDNNAGSADDVFDGSLWDDETGTLVADVTFTAGTAAGPILAEGALGAFAAEDPNGTWTLEVADTAAIDTGTIDAWSLSITTCDCP